MHRACMFAEVTQQCFGGTLQRLHGAEEEVSISCDAICCCFHSAALSSKSLCPRISNTVDDLTSTSCMLISPIQLNMRQSLPLFLGLAAVGFAQDSTAPVTGSTISAPAPTDAPSSTYSAAPSSSSTATSTSQGPITHTIQVGLVGRLILSLEKHTDFVDRVATQWCLM